LNVRIILNNAPAYEGGATMNGSKKHAIEGKTKLYLYSLLGISLLLTKTSDAAKPERPPPEPEVNSIDLAGGFVENMGFVAAGDAGVDFTNEAIRDLAVSIGQLGGVNPETGEVIINEGNLLPLVAQGLDITGSAYFYTNIYIAGDTFVYGAFYGSGAGISNIPSTSIYGSLADRPEIQEALNSKLDVDGVWSAIYGNESAISNLLQSVLTLDQASTIWNAAYQWGNHAEAGYAGRSELETHTGATNNPHQLQANQIGALPKAGGQMTGHIDLGGFARIINMPEPANDRDAVSKSYLDSRLNYILPQGDIEMGVYTNSPFP
jgi:hypothetical protein